MEPIRDAPPGYVAVQDLWADDFLINTDPVRRRSTRPASVTADAGGSAMALHWYLWVVVAVVVVLTVVAIAVAG